MVFGAWRFGFIEVMYAKMDGQTCHLVGLRDFTDSKPFALSRGPTGDGEEAHREFGVS